MIPQGNTPPFPDGETLVLGRQYRYTNAAPFTNTYRFHLDAPTQIAFAAQTPNSQVRIEWRGPKGLLDSRRLTDDAWVVQAAPEGDYSVQVWSTATTPQLVAFNYQDLAASPLVAIDGQTRRTTNSPANDDVFVRVNLTAGTQVYTLNQGSTRSDYGLAWRWFDPFGNPLRYPWGSIVEAGNSDIGTFTAPYSGTYSLGFGSYIHESVPNIVRDYALIQVTNRQVDLVLGEEYSGKVAMPGQVITHRFTLTEKTPVLVDIRSNTIAYWRLEGPSGIIWNPRFNNDSLWYQELVPGDYRMVVHANGSDTPGYRFSLQDLRTGPLVTTGATNSISFPNTWSHIQHVNLVAGQSFYARAISQSGFNTYGTAYWTLIDPMFRRVWDEPFRDKGVITPEVSGNYTLLVSGASGDSGATGSASHAFLPVQNTTEDIQPNTVISGAIQQPGQHRAYRFTLTNPTRISVDALASGNVRFNLSGPTGTIVDDLLQYDRWWWYDLPAGQYVFDVRNDSGQMPSYQFQIATTQDATTLTPDATGTLAFPTATSSRWARIPLAAGQRIAVSVVAVSGYNTGYTPSWLLLTPNGSQLTYNNLNVTEAPVTGVYDLLVGGNLGQPLNPASAEARVSLVPVSTSPISLDKP